MSSANHGSLSDVEERVGVPEDYLRKELFEGRRKRRLGEFVGLTQFGVNVTTLEPGAYSALRHWHEGEDEFVYVLSGELTLIDETGERILESECFCGFPAGVRNGHHIANLSNELASFIEVGSKRPGQDVVHYPDDEFGPFKR